MQFKFCVLRFPLGSRGVLHEISNNRASFLDGQHFARLRDQQFRKRSEAPAPLPARGPPSSIPPPADDAPQLIAVMQKILAERFRQLDLSRGQSLFHLREFHEKESFNRG